MGKLSAVWDLFRKGNEVANVERWKSGQVSANTIALFLASLLATGKAFGYSLPVSDGDIVAIAGGLFALANIIFTVVSSSRSGILPAKVQPDGQLDDARPAEPERTAVDRHQHDYPRDQGGGG